MTRLPCPERPAAQQDAEFTSPIYWNGLIRMGLSKLFVLAALAERPRHGYDLARRVQEMTRGCCAPSAGALYPALTKFEAGGYVTVTRELAGGRTRKIYALTPRGEFALRVAKEAWQDASRVLIDGEETPAPDGVDADGG